MFCLVRAIALAALAAASLLLAANAHAAFPDRQITLIVPWAAGGGTDAIARMIGQMLERDLKQPVNVVNRTGGSGVIGHQRPKTVELGLARGQPLVGPHRAVSYTHLTLPTILLV